MNNSPLLLCPTCSGRTQAVLKSWSELSGGKIKDLDESDNAEIEARFRAEMKRSGLTKKQRDWAVRDERERKLEDAEYAAKKRCRCAESRWAWFKRVVLRQDGSDLLKSLLFPFVLSALVVIPQRSHARIGTRKSKPP